MRFWIMGQVCGVLGLMIFNPDLLWISSLLFLGLAFHVIHYASLIRREENEKAIKKDELSSKSAEKSI